MVSNTGIAAVSDIEITDPLVGILTLISGNEFVDSEQQIRILNQIISQINSNVFDQISL